MQILHYFMKTHLYGNALFDWGIAIICGLLVFAVLSLVRGLIVARTGEKKPPAQQSAFVRMVGAVARATHMFFFAVLALLVFREFLTIPRGVAHSLSALVMIATMIQLGLWCTAISEIWISHHVVRRAVRGPESASAAQIIKLFSLAIIWSVVVLFTLDNFGVNISGLIAGLGIGGVAIAFALQSVLKDLFASLAIVLDKPFMVGDSITFGDHAGTVERIGIKTTRVRSNGGEQITISNDALLNMSISNYKRMEERRILFNVMLTFETPVEALEKIPGAIRDLVRATQNCRFDRSHVAMFEEYGPRIETVYYVLSSDYAVYMNIQQHINFEIARYFAANGIHFAYPARRLIGADMPEKQKS